MVTACAQNALSGAREKHWENVSIYTWGFETFNYPLLYTLDLAVV